MHYVYVLKSLKNSQRYIGYSNDLKKRLKDHNAGYCKHTAKFIPWKIDCYFAFSDEQKARRFEKYLKSGSGVSFAQRHF